MLVPDSRPGPCLASSIASISSWGACLVFLLTLLAPLIPYWTMPDPAGPTSLMPAPSEWLWCVMVLGGFLIPPGLHGSWQKGCFFPAVGRAALAQQWWKWMLLHQLVLWGSLKRSSWGFLGLQTEPPNFCVFP